MKKIDKMLIGTSLFGYFALAISLLLMPIGQNPLSAETNTITIISGIIFWLGFVVGIFPQIVLTIRRRNWVKIHGKKAFRRNIKTRLIFGYFKNPISLAFYIFTIVAIIGLAISINMTRGTGVSCYVFISLFILSVCYHYIFNGKNYIYMKNSVKEKDCVKNEKNRKENDDAENKK